MRVLIVEDSHNRMHYFRMNLVGTSIDHADRIQHADGLIRANTYDIVFLDYDLDEAGLNVGCGGDVANLISLLTTFAQYPSNKARHIVHSLNPSGAKYMFDTVREAGLWVVCRPQIWEEGDVLQRLIREPEWLPESTPLPTLEFE